MLVGKINSAPRYQQNFGRALSSATIEKGLKIAEGDKALLGALTDLETNAAKNADFHVDYRNENGFHYIDLIQPDKTKLRHESFKLSEEQLKEKNGFFNILKLQVDNAEMYKKHYSK